MVAIIWRKKKMPWKKNAASAQLDSSDSFVESFNHDAGKAKERAVAEIEPACKHFYESDCLPLRHPVCVNLDDITKFYDISSYGNDKMHTFTERNKYDTLSNFKASTIAHIYFFKAKGKYLWKKKKVKLHRSVAKTNKIGKPKSYLQYFEIFLGTIIVIILIQ